MQLERLVMRLSQGVIEDKVAESGVTVLTSMTGGFAATQAP